MEREVLAAMTEGETDESGWPKKFPDVDGVVYSDKYTWKSEPEYKRPSDHLVDAAKAVIPEVIGDAPILSNFVCRVCDELKLRECVPLELLSGEPSMIASELVRKLRGRGVGVAAAQWAISDMLSSGKLFLFPVTRDWVFFATHAPGACDRNLDSAGSAYDTFRVEPTCLLWGDNTTHDVEGSSPRGINMKKQKRSGGRKTKWDGLRKIITNAGPDDTDEMLAARFRQHYPSHPDRDKVDAKKVKDVRAEMKRRRPKK